MNSTARTVGLPDWPPGFWRRIILQPSRRWIGAALEDDIHSFRLRLDHADGEVVSVAGTMLRHPWTACPGAVGQLQRELVGKRLEDVAALEPRQHCTHLLDLAILCAAHARDEGPSQFDMKVADRVDGRTTAILREGGLDRVQWRLDGLDIVAPAEGPARNLRMLSQWKSELSPKQAEWATLLRRAVFVSGGRQFVPPPGEQTADRGAARLGACFNYQLPQASRSTRTSDWRKDFSTLDEAPLQGLDPERALATLKEKA